MKITWFGGTTVRVHIGGMILVVGAENLPHGIDPNELVSGADRVIAAEAAELKTVDLAIWRPRRAGRLMDEDDVSKVEVWGAGQGCVLVEAVGESPLLLVSDKMPVPGRWAGQAIVLLMGSSGQLAEIGRQLLEQSPPRLLALAGNDATVDTAITALRDRLDRTGLIALEAGLAVEV